ncbi:uncharacterized protein LOC120538303 [Polypterus senegalus]|uniref:uncharacterized protein LOC120538303 n=1 Tax=Polypterus senegalus TaxID=55291 RepID=UPI0019669A31|nr:uncharacterized protein LOC120538303 [Polypterus senegalus]
MWLSQAFRYFLYISLLSLHLTSYAEPQHCVDLPHLPAVGRVCQGVTVSQPQGSVEAREGNTVTLICVMSSDTPLGPVRWYKGYGSERTHFYSVVPKEGDKNDPRVTWTVENTTVNFSITIRDVRVSDTGEYYCEKYTMADWDKPNASPFASGLGVSLTVIGGQHSVTFFVFMCYLIFLIDQNLCAWFSVFQPQGHIEKMEGSDVTLICHMSSGTVLGPVRWYRGAGSKHTHFYSGAPKYGDANDPRVTWTVENPIVNFSITIRDLRVSDMGEYYCEKYTKGDENKPYASGPGVTLTVRGLSVSQPQGRVEALERSDVTLVCVMSSETPLGPVRWYKGAGSERTHFYSAIPKGGDKNDPRVTWTMENPTVNYSITIRDLRVSDTGKYYCEKYTKADESKPYASGPGVTLTVTEAIKESWEVSGHLLSFFNLFLFDRHDSHQLFLSQVTFSSSSTGVPIITGPASRVKVGNDLELTCEVNGASDITVKWFKDEQEVTPELRDTSGGGKSSRSVIRLTAKIQDIKSVIRCQESGLSAQTPLEDKFHLKDVIAVLPGVPVIENPKLVLGDLVIMTCKLSGVYPKDIKVTWDKTFESSQSQHSEEHEDGTFTVTSVLSFIVKEDMRGTRLTCQAGYEGLTPVSGAVTLGVRDIKAAPVKLGVGGGGRFFDSHCFCYTKLDNKLNKITEHALV